MTTLLKSDQLAGQIAKALPAANAAADGAAVVVAAGAVAQVAEYLKNTPELALDYLQSVTAVDYTDYFEVVYHLTSIQHNHMTVLKARCYDRANPAVPSVVGVWRGADLQERETYDLMGITFTGHPNLKRILLWDGFQGHPLRRDYL